MDRRTYTREARKYQPFIANVGGDVVIEKLSATYHSELLGLNADDHLQYAAADGEGTRPAYIAERLNRLISNGFGITGGGLLTGDLTLTVDAASDPQTTARVLASDAGGLLTLQSLKMRGDLLPFAPDGANIGSSSYPFLTGHISELYGTRFIEETIQVAGGHWIIPKSSATLASPLNTSATTLSVEASQAWSVGDWLILREVGQVEYMKVTGGSGTSWTVTRNMDGSGANSWGNPTAVVNLGGTAGGWLEAQGGTTSAFSVWRRTGTSYANVLEVARLGNLNGVFGVATEQYGVGLGDYAGNKYLKYTPASGLVVRGTIQADDGYLGDLTISGLTSLSSTGELRAGSDASNGIRLGYLTDGYYLRGMSGGATQFELRASDGKAYAGGGLVVLDSGGLSIETGTATASKIKFRDSGTMMASIGFDLGAVSGPEMKFVVPSSYMSLTPNRLYAPEIWADTLCYTHLRGERSGSQ